MDDTDRRIINGLQGGFPIVERPFAVLSEQFGLDEDDLITASSGCAPKAVSAASARCTMPTGSAAAPAWPPWRYRKTGSRRSRRKSTRIPRWRTTMPARTRSTCGSSSPPRLPERIELVLSEIAAETGLAVYAMPKLEEYFVGARFDA